MFIEYIVYKKAKEWFKDHDFNTMIWPSQSPDLNPIEHLWGHLKKKLAEYQEPPKGITELWERVEKEWEAIRKKVCQNLIETEEKKKLSYSHIELLKEDTWMLWKTKMEAILDDKELLPWIKDKKKKTKIQIVGDSEEIQAHEDEIKE
ncbi:uncharacterized protein LAESUDRAFT_754228 [Laetiporus sulphureus 93-53]|uniref:Tc1-like transposase DDE domain-containing protein n=1 Tax=Laetiporus sulphureus 93-53 TaxID=1314785 RepID=A0A165IL62_9APHY|nr:uncharacterized protein LAESUDRAFT_754228 [Laetiporus sulphureus 93-53]KZT13234.1 hypothetical protein LAESUDRAFT_754228 [Laetiporus sulphureus 93-53]